jgi:hypothetical protein
LGDSPAGAVVAAGASGFALGQIIAPFTIEPLVDLLNNNKDDVEKDLAKFAQSNKENPSKPRSCPTDNSGGGAKGPPPAAGDVGADAPDPNEGLGKAIANGHAFDKHVVKRGEFADLGINSRDDFAAHIDDVVSNATGSDVRELSSGRSAYWDDSTGTVVIRDPASPDFGTAFRPVSGRLYFEGLE